MIMSVTYGVAIKHTRQYIMAIFYKHFLFFFEHTLRHDPTPNATQTTNTVHS